MSEGPPDGALDEGSGRLNLLEVSGLSKSFGATRALEDASLTIRPGEVRGLVGENGSGKSTLVKVLAGYHMPDPGATVVVGGAQLDFPLTGAKVRRAGLNFVHQDLGLIPALSVTENLFTDRYSLGRNRHISWRAEHAEAGRALDAFGVDVDPQARVSSLPMELRVMIAIVRAVSGVRATGAGSGVLVLDEPTVSLPAGGRERLRGLVTQVVAAGHGALFISHYPDEVLSWADSVTVLRDGHVVADRLTSELDERSLVALIIGRELEATQFRASADASASASADASADASASGGAGPTRGEVVVEDLSGGELAPLSLGFGFGEVVGVTGLLGSGFEEICYALAGARCPRSGVLRISGRSYDLRRHSPRAAMAAGVAYVPQDRLSEGGSASLTLAENISLPVLGRHTGHLGRLRHREVAAEVHGLLREFNVRPALPGALLRELSGGNQQRVMMAKAMASHPRVLVLLEPTQGVDVGARTEILAKLREIARHGSLVVLGSTDAEQLAQVCDRVVVLRRGEVVADLSGPAVSEERIEEEMYRPVGGAPLQPLQEAQAQLLAREGR